MIESKKSNPKPKTKISSWVVVNKPVDELLNYKYNNKIHNEKQISLLMESIKEYGFNSPVIIDINNTLIAWHWRVEAAKKLWLNEIPVIVKNNLTNKQIKKYRLLDNKIAELATNNIEAIQFELEELQDLEMDELFINITETEDIDFDNIESNEDRSSSDRTREVECPHCWDKFSI